jgi:hypothetical protein
MSLIFVPIKPTQEEINLYLRNHRIHCDKLMKIDSEIIRLTNKLDRINYGDIVKSMNERKLYIGNEWTEETIKLAHTNLYCKIRKNIY